MTSGTYRSHTQRLMTGDIPLYAGVTLALGRPADKPISVWEEMFLPVRMANDIRTVRIADSTGTQIPLVRSEMAIFTAGRAPEPAERRRNLRSTSRCSSASESFTPGCLSCW